MWRRDGLAARLVYDLNLTADRAEQCCSEDGVGDRSGTEWAESDEEDGAIVCGG